MQAQQGGRRLASGSGHHGQGRVSRMMAVVMLLAAAGLGLGARAEEPLPPATPPAESSQLEKFFEKEITVTARYKYLLALPEGYDTGTQRWPLILFLHGAGESGKVLAKVKVHGPPKMIEEKTREFPCIVVSPQSSGRGWNPDYLGALLDSICETYRVDPERIYLTGLSMGGYGTWMLAAAQPDRFAAIVPICGGGNPDDAENLKGLPIWVFHGAQDKIVKLENSEKMVDALKAVGSDVKFTVYPEAGHDSWTETYANPELYTWLFAQKRAAKP